MTQWRDCIACCLCPLAPAPLSPRLASCFTVTCVSSAGAKGGLPLLLPLRQRASTQSKLSSFFSRARLPRLHLALASPPYQRACGPRLARTLLIPLPLLSALRSDLPGRPSPSSAATASANRRPLPRPRPSLSQAVKTLVKWTQRKKEDESIQAFVLRISELEEESCNVDRK